MSATTTDIEQAGVVSDQEAVSEVGHAQVADEEFLFEELPDAPPKQGLRFSMVGKIAIAIVTFWVVLAFIGPSIAPYDQAFFIEDDLQGNIIDDPGFMFPNAQAYMGTDYIGRDIMSRIIYGARTTIGIAFAATMLAYFVGITLGIAAAVAGGWTDTVISRIVDAILSFPNIMLGLIIIAAFESSIPLLIGLAGFVYAASVYRIARALGQDIMVQDFVEAARARGEGLWYIIRREILPNAVMPLATDFGLRFVFVILFISSLSFLGLGVQPPVADWGSMVRENLQGLSNGFGFITTADFGFNWATLVEWTTWKTSSNGGAFAVLAPAFAIASLTIAINLIVDDISAHAGGSLAKKMV